MFNEELKGGSEDLGAEVKCNIASNHRLNRVAPLRLDAGEEQEQYAIMPIAPRFMEDPPQVSNVSQAWTMDHGIMEGVGSASVEAGRCSEKTYEGLLQKEGGSRISRHKLRFGVVALSLCRPPHQDYRTKAPSLQIISICSPVQIAAAGGSKYLQPRGEDLAHVRRGHSEEGRQREVIPIHVEHDEGFRRSLPQEEHATPSSPVCSPPSLPVWPRRMSSQNVQMSSQNVRPWVSSQGGGHGRPTQVRGGVRSSSVVPSAETLCMGDKEDRKGSGGIRRDKEGYGLGARRVLTAYHRMIGGERERVRECEAGREGESESDRGWLFSTVSPIPRTPYVLLSLTPSRGDSVHRSDGTPERDERRETRDDRPDDSAYRQGGREGGGRDKPHSRQATLLASLAHGSQTPLYGTLLRSPPPVKP
ncbi:hypothetical protein BJ875DRAFT_511984 [Amylocarpus encephaloides]|uniref:Uncharacterized protein n=1 Tax=Amylocarpus encephaloides TaxID=45428 RepID=A0A9P7YH46_9HELO|nr:hypothetical protein BJ875DRAFT_511984 [Amylocarpus encephaloides]